MWKLLDRQMVFNYVKAYLVCLVSLLGLFIVVDLFMNLDDFIQAHNGFGSVMEHIGIYYGQKSIQVFDRLCESIVLLSAMFTVAWMQRNNELLPLLSAGVSTRRAVRPVLLAGFIMLGLAVLNQELVLPRLDGYLLDNRADLDGAKEKNVTGAYDSGNDVQISGKTAIRKDLVVKDFVCAIPPNRGGPFTIEAREARYIPGGDGQGGTWRLKGAKPPEMPADKSFDFLTPISPGQYDLTVYDADFDLLTRQKNWFSFISTWDLLREMGKTSNGSKLASIAVIFHMRLTRPILGMLLVFMGLSIILWDQNRNLFISAGLCLILTAIFFGACFGCKHLGDHGILSPALAAWLPVIVFGPLSFVMFDAVHT